MLNQAQSWTWLSAAEELALEAIDRIRGARPAMIATKSNPADLITEVDQEIERLVIDRLSDIPGHIVIGEEFGRSAGGPGDLVWYLDPVDGTTNYAHDLGWCSFSLALADDAGLVVGVIGDPYRGEVIGAARGLGARCNGTPIRCSSTDTLSGEVVLTELVSHQPWPGLTRLLDDLAERYATMRIMGSSAMSVVATALGRGAATVLGDVGTLDCAAAVLIAREAGALVWSVGGQDLPVPADGPLLVAAPGVHAEMSELCKALFA